MKVRVGEEVRKNRIYQQSEVGGRLSCLPNVNQKCGWTV